MSDSLMKLTLTDRDFYNNSAQSRILLYIEQHANPGMSNAISDLQDVISSTSVEHILSQDTGNSYSPLANGFIDDDDYEMHKHRLGNLVLMEIPINSVCKNKPVHSKFSEPDCYPRTHLQAVKNISSTGLTRGSPWFDKDVLNSRSDVMAQEIMKHWHL